MPGNARHASAPGRPGSPGSGQDLEQEPSLQLDLSRPSQSPNQRRRAALAEHFSRHRRAWNLAALIVVFCNYYLISHLTIGRALYTPELWLDRLIPLRPGWMFVY